MAEQLRVAIIGCGDMGATHLRAYAALQDVAVVALADPDADRARALAAQYSVEAAYADWRAAIEQELPDIVSVCIPACSHAEAALYALEHGCRVLCEKPIALRLDEARRMLEASDGRLAIVFQRRYLGVWEEVRRRISSLGTPLSYQAADFRCIRPKRLMHARSGNGGPVIDCCVHDFDMAMQLLGPVHTAYGTGAVFAEGKQELRDIPDLAVDAAQLCLKHASGGASLIAYCWGLPTGFETCTRAEVLGPNGLLRIGEGRLEHHMPGGRIETVEGLHTDGHAAQIAAFVHAARESAPLPVSPAEAFETLRVAHGALEAIETGALWTNTQ